MMRGRLRFCRTWEVLAPGRAVVGQLEFQHSQGQWKEFGWMVVLWRSPLQQRPRDIGRSLGKLCLVERWEKHRVGMPRKRKEKKSQESVEQWWGEADGELEEQMVAVRESRVSSKSETAASHKVLSDVLASSFFISCSIHEKFHSSAPPQRKASPTLWGCSVQGAGAVFSWLGITCGLPPHCLGVSWKRELQSWELCSGVQNREDVSNAVSKMSKNYQWPGSLKGEGSWWALSTYKPIYFQSQSSSYIAKVFFIHC